MRLHDGFRSKCFHMYIAISIDFTEMIMWSDN